MEFTFREEQLRELLKGNNEIEHWFEALEQILPLYDINTSKRVAGFISQCAHESNNFRITVENLNYSAKGLNSVFSKYFARAGRNANDYHRQPEKIANLVYANRIGNGDVESGDGWRFKGRGIIQLTGRDNYTKFGDTLSYSPNQAIQYIKRKEGAIESACWFWDKNNINDYCDNMDIVGMTKKINGGTNGLEDRKRHWDHALKVLRDEWNPEEKVTMIKKGSKGPQVKIIQESLGLEADGIFGSDTEKHVIVWQKRNGLIPDGIVGPSTLSALKS